MDAEQLNAIRKRDQEWFHDPRGTQTVAEVVKDRGDLLIEVYRLRDALRESCDENRSVALAEPGRTATCPLAPPR